MSKETKKVVYLILWDLTGMLLGLLLAAMLVLMLERAYGPSIYGLVIFGVFLIAGFIFGLFVGPTAWQKIYVEGARGQKYVIDGAKEAKKSDHMTFDDWYKSFDADKALKATTTLFLWIIILGLLFSFLMGFLGMLFLGHSFREGTFGGRQMPCFTNQNLDN